MTDPSHAITCPNCGFHAKGNYCAECGQPTHLHKESFWGLIMHFFAHYFHYDSKFFMTLKALWFKPGELTLAYWRGQRMKYIPPVSLYIFISAVYFLVSAMMVPAQVKSTEASLKRLKEMGMVAPAKKPVVTDTVITKNGKTIRQTTETKSIDFEQHPEMLQMILEKAIHVLPKLMFFMIPFMGLILKLLFLNRKGIFFVDHVIYSLHWHAFYFSVSIISALIPISIASVIISALISIGILVYSVIALKRTYIMETFEAIGYSILLGAVYMFILGLGMVGYFAWALKDIVG